jgi:hypothetical protein
MPSVHFVGFVLGDFHRLLVSMPAMRVAGLTLITNDPPITTEGNSLLPEIEGVVVINLDRLGWKLTTMILPRIRKGGVVAISAQGSVERLRKWFVHCRKLGVPADYLLFDDADEKLAAAVKSILEP